MHLYEQFIEDAQAILPLYHDLQLSQGEGMVPKLDGKLLLITNAETIDIYQISIKPTVDYPNRFPLVFETAGRIPVNIDWHVYSDGHFCICTIPEELLKCKAQFNLQSFIENELKPYLFNQTHRRVKGYFINEREHGFAGDYQFYCEELRTKDLLEIAKFFQFLIERDEPGRTKNCFCGSGRKYRHCHREVYRKFSVLDNPEIRMIFYKIIHSHHFTNAYPDIAKELFQNQHRTQSL